MCSFVSDFKHIHLFITKCSHSQYYILFELTLFSKLYVCYDQYLATSGNAATSTLTACSPLAFVFRCRCVRVVYMLQCTCACEFLLACVCAPKNKQIFCAKENGGVVVVAVMPCVHVCVFVLVLNSIRFALCGFARNTTLRVRVCVCAFS